MLPPRRQSSAWRPWMEPPWPHIIDAAGAQAIGGAAFDEHLALSVGQVVGMRQRELRGQEADLREVDERVLAVADAGRPPCRRAVGVVHVERRRRPRRPAPCASSSSSSLAVPRPDDRDVAGDQRVRDRRCAQLRPAAGAPRRSVLAAHRRIWPFTPQAEPSSAVSLPWRETVRLVPDERVASSARMPTLRGAAPPASGYKHGARLHEAGRAVADHLQGRRAAPRGTPPRRSPCRRRRLSNVSKASRPPGCGRGTRRGRSGTSRACGTPRSPDAPGRPRASMVRAAV